jgi:asparagine synthase (glutamine-hydrolysing)
MASLVFRLARRRSEPQIEPVLRGLGSAPHRGTEMATRTLGSAVLGVANGDGPSTGSLDADDRLLAAIAGRLDEADELAKELLDEGAAVDVGNPASVVRALFRRDGERAVGRLRGVFEAIVTDGEQAWCWRDQLGFRPLFYRDAPDGFVAATEAKQVAAAAGVTPEPDMDVLDLILFGDFDDDTPSALHGVERLRKSTLLHADHERARRAAYWDPSGLIETAHPDMDELRERFDALMAQAVRRTLTGDDAVSLSGGLDSPTVAAFAAPEHLRLSGRPLGAVSAVYPDQPEVDESVWIEEVAASLGLRLHTYRRAADPLEGLQEWTRLFDGPVPTVVVNDAKEHYDTAVALGYRTMLTGELAEYLVDQRRYLPSHLLRTGRWGPLRGTYRIQRAQGVSTMSFARQLTQTFTPRSVEALRIRARGPARAVGLPSWVDGARVTRAEIAMLEPARDRWNASQLAGLAGPGLTNEADEVCQEVAGIMSRRPWVDVDLYEFFLSLPPEVKYLGRRRKDLIRLLMRGRIPDSIVDRPSKTLFNASIMARVRYDELRRWLLDPPVQVGGIRYDLLADRLRAEDMSLMEYQWAKDLACVHAFLSLW